MLQDNAWHERKKERREGRREEGGETKNSLAVFLKSFNMYISFLLFCVLSQISHYPDWEEDFFLCTSLLAYISDAGFIVTFPCVITMCLGGSDPFILLHVSWGGIFC
jgi:hypothetical protein